MLNPKYYGSPNLDQYISVHCKDPSVTYLLIEMIHTYMAGILKQPVSYQWF